MRFAGRTKRNTLGLLLLFAAGAVLDGMRTPLFDLGGTVFILLFLLWGGQAQERTIERNVKRRMVIVAWLLVFLFFLRACRYIYFWELPEAWSRTAWYFYYVPFLFMTVLGMDIGVCVVNAGNGFAAGRLGAAYVFGALLSALIVTNELHHWAFYPRGGDWSAGYGHGPVYFAAVLYIILCIAYMLFLLIREYRRNHDKHRYYLQPLGVIVVAAAFFVLYYFGRLPRVNGRELVKLQDVVALLAIGLIESCLNIGLIPVARIEEKSAELNDTRRQYEQRSRLYDAMAESVMPQIVQIDGILDREDSPDFDFLLARACVLNAYVKRRCNLMLQAQNRKRVPLEELRYSIAESLEYLRLCHIQGGVFSSGGGEAEIGRILEAYAFFEQVTESILDGAAALLVNLELRGEAIHMRLTVENPTRPPKYRQTPGRAAVQEENNWYIDAVIGGEALT